MRHLLHALGVERPIKSPTYALMEPYEAGADAGGFAISHFDFYRFDDPQEWEDAGFRDVFASPGLKLVEWPEKAAGCCRVRPARRRSTPRDDAATRAALRFEALERTRRASSLS